MTLQFSEKDFQGYQTPMEESQPPFIRTSPPTPNAPTPNSAPIPNHTPNHTPSPKPPPSPAPGPDNIPTPASAPARPNRRPPLLQLPSYYLRRASGQSERHIAPSLDDMLHKGVRRPRGGKVGLRDRIACYQWTFFTMVGFFSFFLWWEGGRGRTRAREGGLERDGRREKVGGREEEGVALCETAWLTLLRRWYVFHLLL